MPKKHKLGNREIEVVSDEEAARLIKDGAHIITDEPDGKCELCGEVAELRPYGPKEEWICFSCGIKDEAAAKRGLNKRASASRR